MVLLAYSDPMDSPVKHLLGLHHRENLALQVNAAILSTIHLPISLLTQPLSLEQTESSLELALRQVVLLHTLHYDADLKNLPDIDNLKLASFLRETANSI